MTFFFLRPRVGLVLLLLLGSLVGQSQPNLAAKAQFQRRLRAMHVGYRYWDAKPDSLRRVLAGQRADTLRLQTLEQLQQLGSTSLTEDQEALALATRLHYPERASLRLFVSADQLWQAKSPNLPAIRDTLQALVAQSDALGPVPLIYVLAVIRSIYDQQNQPEAKRAYFQQKLAYYQQHGPVENLAMCYRFLGGYYDARGDYNQGISYRLRAAELFRTFSNFLYYNEVMVVGADYVEWGNGTRALPYLQQAIEWSGIRYEDKLFINRSIASIYLQQGRYPQALRYATLAVRPRTPRDTVSPYERALGLVPLGAVLLAQGRAAAALPLLQRAQRLGDSLHLPLSSPGGSFELNATWARYYAATGHYAQAEAAWQAAYRQARQQQVATLRLAYLHGLASFYQQRGQPARAAPYALAALGLADTLNAAQAATRVAQYELTQADRAQQARVARLRQQQTQAATQSRRQRRALLWVSGGVFVLLLLATGAFYAFLRSQRLARLVTAQKQDLQSQRDQLDTSLTELRRTQNQLIQKEKMASLGELTAGIAHEIQNPLNFVNNFADVSQELVQELKEAQAAGDLAEVESLADDLGQNLSKIHQHGQRAAGIVRGMLAHSRQSTGERVPTDVNALCDEYLRLAYQGLRAKDKFFNAELKANFAPGLPLVEAVPGDLGRVLLNLFTNAFYAVQQRQQQGEAGYQPTVGVATQQVDGRVEICVRDNGTGIPDGAKAKIFQPFFTTKPTGQGTGLGLSLSYDIVTKGHGGTLDVASQAGEGTTFIIRLPR